MEKYLAEIVQPLLAELSRLKEQPIVKEQLSMLTEKWAHHERATKDFVFYAVLIYALWKTLDFLWVRGIVGPLYQLSGAVGRFMFDLVKWVPGVQAKIDKELDKVIQEIESKLLEHGKGADAFRSLPQKGLSEKAVLAELATLKDMETIYWKSGKVSGTIYHGGDKLSALLTEAYGMFSYTNPLHPDVFPGVRKMEADVISMCLAMYNAPSTSCGSVTSGGTESILMACKTYRDKAYAERGVTEPEMIVPVTVHAAFDKAAAYFKIRIVHVSINPKTWQVDTAQIASSRKIVGSSPNYPHGIIDDIETLGKLAQRYGIGLHVDSCLGSFIVPFLEKAGFDAPLFDFRVKGVTSISCDTHKFGFAPKGSSVIMYRSKELRRYQYSVAPNWPGGIYASPSIAGSRPGALIAGCWAALVNTGEQGYVASTKKIVGSAREIVAGIQKMPELEVCGEPLAMVVAFTSKELNIFSVGDAMSALGWNLNSLQNPAAIHICCTLLTASSTKQLLKDLKAAVAQVKANPDQKKGMGAIYGMAASIPDKRLVVDIAKGYLDVLTK